MNKFTLYWSCTSLVSVSLTAILLRSEWLQLLDLKVSSALTVLCLAYWLSISLLQKRALSWRLQNQQFGNRWFFFAIASGFLPMLLHNLLISSTIDQEGQGALIIYLSLPCLAIVGGLTSALIKLLLFESHNQSQTKLDYRDITWIVVNILKWSFGLATVYYWESSLLAILILIFLFASIAIVEGWMIEKHLYKSATR